jgi:hypothetical protein
MHRRTLKRLKHTMWGNRRQPQSHSPEGRRRDQPHGWPDRPMHSAHVRDAGSGLGHPPLEQVLADSEHVLGEDHPPDPDRASQHNRARQQPQRAVTTVKPPAADRLKPQRQACAEYVPRIPTAARSPQVSRVAGAVLKPLSLHVSPPTSPAKQDVAAVVARGQSQTRRPLAADHAMSGSGSGDALTGTARRSDRAHVTASELQERHLPAVSLA